MKWVSNDIISNFGSHWRLNDETRNFINRKALYIITITFVMFLAETKLSPLRSYKIVGPVKISFQIWLLTHNMLNIISTTNAYWKQVWLYWAISVPVCGVL